MPYDGLRFSEISRVERDGTCRWSYAFEETFTGEFPAYLLAAAGLDGAVIIAGHTYDELTFGDTTVGGDVDHDWTPGADNTPYLFALVLDENGDVIWAEDLGRSGLTALAAGANGDYAVVSYTAGVRHEIIHVNALGGHTCGLEFSGIAPFPEVAAMSPSGDVVIAGRYLDAFELGGLSCARRSHSSASHSPRAVGCAIA